MYRQALLHLCPSATEFSNLAESVYLFLTTQLLKTAMNSVEIPPKNVVRNKQIETLQDVLLIMMKDTKDNELQIAYIYCLHTGD